MDLANTLIYIAGILWTIEALPQIVKLIRTKEVKGISTFFFAICFIAYLLFIIGNIMLRNKSVVIAHIFPFINISTILYLLIKYKR